ncbi:MAG: ABC transporter ATP-binding protein [Pseudomonadota bacterium]
MSAAGAVARRPLIECRGLCKEYLLGGETIHALRDVDLGIDAGDYAAIMGPSGSGKSTLMNLIGALDVPTRGELLVGGTNLGTRDSDQLADFRNETIGFVFQQFNLLARTSAVDNVKLPLLYRRGDRGGDPNDRARACLERVGLGDRMDHEPSQLSGGQQQRVAIARALANEPTVILADEPTGALDTRTSEEILALFDELNRSGITLIVVTHDEEVAAAARRNLLFRDGRLVDDRELR